MSAAFFRGPTGSTETESENEGEKAHPKVRKNERKTQGHSFSKGRSGSSGFLPQEKQGAARDAA